MSIFASFSAVEMPFLASFSVVVVLNGLRGQTLMGILYDAVHRLYPRVASLLQRLGVVSLRKKSRDVAM